MKESKKKKKNLKLKTTQLSLVQESFETKVSNRCKSLEHCEDTLDFSHLQLPEVDVLGVGDDIGSWLNIDDDDGLHDDDIMGLEIPIRWWSTHSF